MLPISPSTAQFAPDQQYSWTLTTWDTPFTPLTNDVASGGLLCSVRQPRDDGTYTLRADLEAAATANLFTTFYDDTKSKLLTGSVQVSGTSTGSNTSTTLNDTGKAWAVDGFKGCLVRITSGTGAGEVRLVTANTATQLTVTPAWSPTPTTGGYQILSMGRIPNVIQYWAGGAPGMFGVSTARQVALHVRGVLRSASGRDWFSAQATPTFSLAVGGCGYVRITKTVGGTVTEIFNKRLVEGEFLTNGLSWSSVVSDVTVGSALDLYYVQDRDDWGGLVVKVVPGSTQSAANAQEAPVLGCGLFDDGRVLAAQTLEHVTTLDLERQVGQSARLRFTVPLVNAQNTDGVGWRAVPAAGTDPGTLQCLRLDGSTVTLRRGRLLRAQLGFVGEEQTGFVGFVDDFELDTGTATVTCVDFAQRCADLHVKNYPDKISYQCFGYRTTQYAGEPVYDIPAYDHWPLEYALRDLLLRAGIDEGRTRATRRVPQADGTSTPVIM
jgi:hypothetical protein